MNRAAAMRELGLVGPARDEISSLLPELERLPARDAQLKGRSRYHLALCQWRLAERDARRRSAAVSLAAYDGAPKDDPVDPGLRRQSEDLLASLKDGRAPAGQPAIDAPAAIEAARAHYRAREALARLPLDQRAEPVLDQILGPARRRPLDASTPSDHYAREQEILDLVPGCSTNGSSLTRSTLGPARPVGDVLDSLDRRYRDQGKPAVWFLPLDEPIAPHLDELLGKSSK